MEELPIRYLQDRTLSAAVTHVTLCPNMLLLAVTLDANTFYRTSWLCLAIISIIRSSPDERITVVSRSPSGAFLAVSTLSTRLIIYSVDHAVSTGARRRTCVTQPVASHNNSASATALVWVPSPSSTTSPNDSNYEDRASLLLLIVSPLSMPPCNRRHHLVCLRRISCLLVNQMGLYQSIE